MPGKAIEVSHQSYFNSISKIAPSRRLRPAGRHISPLGVEKRIPLCRSVAMGARQICAAAAALDRGPPTVSPFHQRAEGSQPSSSARLRILSFRPRWRGDGVESDLGCDAITQTRQNYATKKWWCMVVSLNDLCQFLLGLR